MEFTVLGAGFDQVRRGPGGLPGRGDNLKKALENDRPGQIGQMHFGAHVSLQSKGCRDFLYP